MSNQSLRSSIAVQPTGIYDWISEAVITAGGTIAAAPAASGLVWLGGGKDLASILDACPNLEWIQLASAGVEKYIDVIRAHPDRIWTCSKGIYADAVAEHAVGLAIAGLRGLPSFARARQWTAQGGRSLSGARVVIVGGGGIANSLLRLLEPFGCAVIVVRRTPQPMEGARVVGVGAFDDVLSEADVVILALALTPDTVGILDKRRFRLLPPHAWVVNVARGKHIVTDDLTEALAAGAIGGAALDVTDPEPLPAEHPLWSQPRCLITPHTANTEAMARPRLIQLVHDNVRRWIAAEDLIGGVDVNAGY